MEESQRGQIDFKSLQVSIPEYLNSFDATFVQFEKMIFKIAHKFTSNPHLIDDLVQEGYLGLHQAIGMFDLRYNSQFSTLAYKYIEGYMLNFLNRDIRWKKLNKIIDDEIDLNFQGDDDIECISDNLVLQRIRKMISLMPDQKNKIMNLYLNENLNVTEIAEKLFISKQRVSKVINETVKILKHNFN